MGDVSSEGVATGPRQAAKAMGSSIARRARYTPAWWPIRQWAATRSRPGESQKEPPPRWWVTAAKARGGTRPCGWVPREIATRAKSRRGSPLRRPRGADSQVLAFPASARGSFHSSTVSNLNRAPLSSRAGPAGTSSERRPPPVPERDPSGLRSPGGDRGGDAGRRCIPVRGCDHKKDRSAVCPARRPIRSKGQLQPMEFPQFRHL